MNLLASEQVVSSGLSDMLLLQTEAVFVVVVVLITAGVLFWLFGSQFHRLFLTVLLLSAGIVVGWDRANVFGVNVFLGMTIGAVIGAALGYWLFRVWLGLFSASIISLVLMILYSSFWVVPFLDNARQQRLSDLAREGITHLKSPTTQLAGPTETLSIASQETEMTPGDAYRKLLELLPGLKRGSYETWEDWRESVYPTAKAIVNSLSNIEVYFTTALLLTLAVSLAAGLLLTYFKPVILNIAYTSSIGTLMVFLAIGLLLTLRKTTQIPWLSQNPWLIGMCMLLMVLVGAVLQYTLFVQSSADDEEDEEEEEYEPPAPRGKSKKK